MEQLIENKRLKSKGITIALMILSFLMFSAGNIAAFIRYLDGNASSPTLYWLRLIFPSRLANVISIMEVVVSILAFLLPITLIIVYLCIGDRATKAKILMPISFGLLALPAIVNCLSYAIVFVSNICNLVTTRYYYLPLGITYITKAFFDATLYFVLFIAFIFLLIASFKGFVKKSLAIIPAVLAIPVCCLQVVSSIFAYIFEIVYYESLFGAYISYFDTYILNYVLLIISVIMTTMAFVPLLVAIIIFVAKNKASELNPTSDENIDQLMVKKPKKAFDILKVRFEKGEIGEEEYHTRVAEIENAKLELLIEKDPKMAFDILKVRYECGKISEEKYQEYMSKITLNL